MAIGAVEVTALTKQRRANGPWKIQGRNLSYSPQTQEISPWFLIWP
jgi:hypothetical protein